MDEEFEVKFSYLELDSSVTAQGIKYRRLGRKLSDIGTLAPRGGVLVQTNFGFECFVGIRDLLMFWIPTACCGGFEISPGIEYTDIYSTTDYYRDYSCKTCDKKLQRNYHTIWHTPISENYNLDILLEHWLADHLGSLDAILIASVLERKLNRVLQGRCLLDKKPELCTPEFEALLSRESGRLDFFAPKAKQ